MTRALTELGVLAGIEQHHAEGYTILATFLSYPVIGGTLGNLAEKVLRKNSDEDIIIDTGFDYAFAKTPEEKHDIMNKLLTGIMNK